jgi:hypothetical protein
MRTKCRSISTFHRPIHSHWSLPLSILEELQSRKFVLKRYNGLHFILFLKYFFNVAGISTAVISLLPLLVSAVLLYSGWTKLQQENTPQIMKILEGSSLFFIYLTERFASICIFLLTDSRLFKCTIEKRSYLRVVIWNLNFIAEIWQRNHIKSSRREMDKWLWQEYKNSEQWQDVAQW